MVLKGENVWKEALLAVPQQVLPRQSSLAAGLLAADHFPICAMAVSGGGQLTLQPHLLSRDGKHLLVCSGSNVLCYSSVTAQLLLTLSAHSDEVTSLALHPSNTAQVRPHAMALEGLAALLGGSEGSMVCSSQ